MWALIIGAVVVLAVLIVAAVGARGRRGRPETVIPRRVDTCSHAQDVLFEGASDPNCALHWWSGPDNRYWTTATTPWDPDSKTQLALSALTASAGERYQPINPYTRVGITSRVLNWDNPYVGAGGDPNVTPCSSKVSAFEVQPFQTGFMVKAENGSTDGTWAEGRYYYQPAYWDWSSGPLGGPYKPLADCAGDLAAVRGRAAAAGPAAEQKETLRSRGGYREVGRRDQCLTGIGCGLGSTWIDPRFEPNPIQVYPSDSVPAPGTHAGGPTFGSFDPTVFRPGPEWSRYVRGFGDGHLVAPSEE